MEECIILKTQIIKRRRFKIERVIIAILVVYFIYSFIGVIFGTEYTKSNGNTCKGFPGGIQVCSGDINAD